MFLRVLFTYTKKNSREGTHKGLCVGMRRRRDQTHRMSDMVRKSCTRHFLHYHVCCVILEGGIILEGIFGADP